MVFVARWAAKVAGVPEVTMSSTEPDQFLRERGEKLDSPACIATFDEQIAPLNPTELSQSGILLFDFFGAVGTTGP